MGNELLSLPVMGSNTFVKYLKLSNNFSWVYIVDTRLLKKENCATILKLYVELELDQIPPTIINLNYNGNTVHLFESYLNQISKMAMYLNRI